MKLLCAKVRYAIMRHHFMHQLEFDFRMKNPVLLLISLVDIVMAPHSAIKLDSLKNYSRAMIVDIAVSKRTKFEY